MVCLRIAKFGSELTLQIRNKKVPAITSTVPTQNNLWNSTSINSMSASFQYQHMHSAMFLINDTLKIAKKS